MKGHGNGYSISVNNIVHRYLVHTLLAGGKSKKRKRGNLGGSARGQADLGSASV